MRGHKPGMDEKGHLSNTIERNQSMKDTLLFPLYPRAHSNIKIRIGCTTGTLEEFVNILNHCKTL